MTKPYWYKLFEDPILRQYFSDICKAFTKIPEFQEDLYQEAWVRVGMCDEGLTTEYYMHQGFKAMNGYYVEKWRTWKVIRMGFDYNPYKEARRKRIERKREKFKVTVQKTLLERPMHNRGVKYFEFICT